MESTTPDLQRAAAWHCLIDLQDSWVRFCKAAVLISAKGRVVTKHGLRVARSPVVGKHDDPEVVLLKLLKQNNPHRSPFGPKWELPAITIQAAQLLDIANFAQFSAGIGATSPAPMELKACRNYLAHRHQGTAMHKDLHDLRRRVRAPAELVAPAALAAHPVPGSGVLLFEEWCIELNALAGAAIS